MPNEVHSTITTLFIALAFSLGIIVGGSLAAMEARKAYGTRHELLFEPRSAKAESLLFVRK